MQTSSAIFPPQSHALDKHALSQAIAAHLIAQVNASLEHLASLQQSLGAESKSTAGDKHETGRAMVQREMEQAEAARQRAKLLLDQFQQSAATSDQQVAGSGALVELNTGWFWLGVPFGKVETPAGTAFGISMASPLGQALAGKRPGDPITLNGKSFELKRLV